MSFIYIYILKDGQSSENFSKIIKFSAVCIGIGGYSGLELANNIKKSKYNWLYQSIYFILLIFGLVFSFSKSLDSYSKEIIILSILIYIGSFIYLRQERFD